MSPGGVYEGIGGTGVGIDQVLSFERHEQRIERRSVIEMNERWPFGLVSLV